MAGKLSTFSKTDGSRRAGRVSIRLSSAGRLRMAVVGALGLLAIAPLADAAQVGSAAWFSSAAAASAGATAQASGAASSPAGLLSAMAAKAVTVPTAAYTQASRSIANLNAALAAIARSQQAQSSVAPTAQTITSGIGPNGLNALTNNAAGCASANTCLWLNADAPVASTNANSNSTVVTVRQTAPKAILTWSNFDISANTTLNFNQSAGNQADGSNSWIALNRVVGSNHPAQIFGNINAQGSVYILDPNGIIFGNGSRVNVNSLLASSLPLYLPQSSKSLLNGFTDPSALAYSNSVFLNSGITTGGAGSANGFILGSSSGAATAQANLQTVQQSDGTAATRLVLGDIDVQANAVVNIGSANQAAAPVTLSNGVSASTFSGVSTSGSSTSAGSASTSSSSPASKQTNSLGYALLVAPNISNEGTVHAADGQIMMAAGVGLTLGNLNSNSQLLSASLTGAINNTTASGTSDATPVSTIKNTGVLESDRGNITLMATSLSQLGVAEATTSVSRAGTISLVAQDEQGQNRPRAGLVDFGAASVTSILPDTNGETTTSSASATSAFQAGSVKAVGSAVTLDGGSGGGALIEAPGENVSLSAIAENDVSVNVGVIPVDATGKPIAIAGRVFVDNSATIDVSGLNLQLPVSANLVTIAHLGQNDLADDPTAKNSFLLGSSIVFDSRITGVLGVDAQGNAYASPSAQGEAWVGTPLANLQGYVEAVSRNVKQLLLNGGQVTLAGNEVLTQQGSSLNLNAGFTEYQGGYVNTTQLIAANGTLVNIANANPSQTYLGIAGQSQVSNSRFNITENFSNPVLQGKSNAGAYESSYIQSGNAGSLTVYGAETSVLNGSLTAQSFAGRQQVATNSLPKGGTLNMGITSTGLVNSLYPAAPAFLDTPNLLVVNNEPVLNSLASGGFAAATTLNDSIIGSDASGNSLDLFRWTPVPAGLIQSGGFSKVNLVADNPSAGNQGGGGEILMGQGVNLAVAPGGSVSMTAAAITLDGIVTAKGGSISLTSTGHTYGAGSLIAQQANPDPLPGNIEIERHAVLDASGQWINDSGAASLDDLGGSQFINGGSVSISTLQNSVQSNSILNTIVDTTGAIDLQQGSLINVSSGGYVQANGTLKTIKGDNLIPQGKGGNVTLQTYIPQTLPFGPKGDLHLPGNISNPQPLSTGKLLLGGTLQGYGFSGGGTLKLGALGIQIGGDVSASAPWNLVLPANFFEGTGFGTIDLRAEYNASVLSDTYVRITQDNYLPKLTANASGANKFALLYAPTGTDFFNSSGYVSLGQVDGYHRQAVNFSLFGGDYANWQTEGFVVPDYSKQGITGATLIGANALIQADPGAAITLGSDTQVTVLGKIHAQGGSITLTGDTANGGYSEVPGNIPNLQAFSSNSKSVWLGADALLDVSGTALVNPLTSNTPGSGLSFGRVLDGGTVTLTNDDGFVVAVNCKDAGTCPAGTSTTGNGSNSMPAATINISGASAVLGEPLGVNGTEVSTQVVSNAGTLKIGAGEGLLLHADLNAHAGGSSAEGGTLYVTPEIGKVTTAAAAQGAGATLLQVGSATTMPTGLTPGSTIVATPNGVLNFSTDLLNNTGISTVHLGSDPLLNQTKSAVPISVVSGTNILVDRAIYLNASGFEASGAVVKNVKQAVSAGFTAPYVDITGYQFGGNYQNGGCDPLGGCDTNIFGTKGLIGSAANNSTFSIFASRGLDIGGQFVFDNFSTVNMATAGDMRFVTPSTYDYLTNPSDPVTASTIPGLLMTTGTLNLTASQLYPATNNKFVVIAQDNNYTQTATKKNPNPAPVTSAGSINISRYDNLAALPDSPLSAAGTLIFESSSIQQNGVVRAPDGQLYFGVSSLPTVSATKSVTQATLTTLPTDFYFNSVADQLLTYNASCATLTGYCQEQGASLGASIQVALPLIATKSVTFGSNSYSSVSLDGTTVPFGTTVDGQNLQFNGSATSLGTVAQDMPTLQSAPAKILSAVGNTVTLNAGARLDITGSGDLQAQEWVAGTGGSRNVLKDVNTSFASGSAVQVPLYADGRKVYAVIPGYSSVTAAYDPSLVQDPLVGQSVQLTGVPGLPSGTYTLLPGSYANLPGAFRVVQDSRYAAFNTAPQQQLADGSYVTSGALVDSLTGLSSAPGMFYVQSGNTWQKYSQFTLTSENSYYASATAVAAGAYRPFDAGQANFNVGKALVGSLSQSLLTAAPTGATGAELDIAAPLLEIGNADPHPLPNYLTLEASDLNNTGVSRLVLGGISSRTTTTSGTQVIGVDAINALSTGLFINTTSTALVAPEILALTQTKLGVTDTGGNEVITSDTAGDGLVVAPGAQLTASGAYNKARDLSIQIGLTSGCDTACTQATSNATYAVNGAVTVGQNGDGALLRLSNGAPVSISRQNVAGVDVAAPTGTTNFTPLGEVTIGANAQLSAQGSISLDGAGSTVIDPSASLTTPELDANSSRVTFASNQPTALPPPGLLVSNALLASLSGIGDISFSSRGNVYFNGDVAINAGSSKLEISGGDFLSTGGAAFDPANVSITAGSLTLANDLGAPTTAAPTGSAFGRLTIKTSELNLGDTNPVNIGKSAGMVFGGFSTVDITATSGIVARGGNNGTGVPLGIDLGGASVSLHTPTLVAASASNIALTTTGSFTADQQGGGVALTDTDLANGCQVAGSSSYCKSSAVRTQFGGSIAVTAGSVALATDLSATAGTLNVHATQGDVVVGSAINAGVLSVAGTTHSVFDATQYMTGGTLRLTSDTGAVRLTNGSSLNFAGASSATGTALSAGGSLLISAAGGGDLTGGAVLGQGTTGGNLSLESGSAVDLNLLSAQLASGGVTGKVAVHTHAGNLTLAAGNAINARSVALTADGGKGSSDLANGNIRIDGTLNTSGVTGGDITLFGSSSVNLTGSLLAVSSSSTQLGGNILLGAGAGGNGTVNSQYGYENVDAASSGKLTLASTAVLDVSGGSAGGLAGGTVKLRSALLDTATPSLGISATNGLTIKGARSVAVEAYGIWSTQDSSTGAQHFDGIIDPAGTFSATGTSAATSAHSGFYTGTLATFVQQTGSSVLDSSSFNTLNALGNLKVTPGIDLVNASTSINSGDISLLGDWNLNAGSSASSLLYRNAAGFAPTLTLQAAGNIRAAASLSDGFYQNANPLTAAVDNSAAPGVLSLVQSSLAGGDSSSYRLVAGADTTSSNPLALAPATAFTSGSLQGSGNIILSGDEVSAKQANANNLVFVAPTMVRTGTGSISIAAAGNLQLTDTKAPGVIYTAGTPAIAGGVAGNSSLIQGVSGMPLFIDTGSVQPQGGGNIDISVRGAINAVQAVADTDGSRTGFGATTKGAGTDLTQFWWPWMQSACIITTNGCTSAQTASSLNFGMFDQGVLSAGGNVSVHAGGSITGLSVSVPTTWSLGTDGNGNTVVNTYGGGNLDVSTDSNLFSGSYLVGHGTGSLSAAGVINNNIVDSGFFPLATLLGVQDGTFNVQSGHFMQIGGIFNPSYLFKQFDSQSYSAASSVNLQALAGDVVVGSTNPLILPGAAYGFNSVSPLQKSYSYLWPASVSASSVGGGIQIESSAELYPSATGNLTLLAANDITLSNNNYPNTHLGLIDAPAADLPSPLNPVGSTVAPSFIYNGGQSNYQLHTITPLHANDTQPMRIYSLDGSIVDGQAALNYQGAVIVTSDKPAQIQSGLDIVNLSFQGQNLNPSDITLIQAGRDLYDPALAPSESVPVINLGGVGSLELGAGRNLGPLTSANDALSEGYLTAQGPQYPGIYTIGNSFNAYLTREGANILINFGVGPGVDYTGFANAYVDPNKSVVPDLPDTSGAMEAFVQAWQRANNAATVVQSGADAWNVFQSLPVNIRALYYNLPMLSAVQQYEKDHGLPVATTLDAAWTAFQNELPALQQHLVDSEVFIKYLSMVGEDYNSSTSKFAGQYGRGYAAINVLFPGSSGYTRNDLSGHTNGALSTVSTGTLDMRGSTIQTTSGGDINILGPGGSVLIGSESAPPQEAPSATTAGIGPNNQGILTLESGAIGIFVDQNVLLAQSRIFTEQGGDVTIWSSNADINAGKGAKTSSIVPPPSYLCDPDHFCLVDSRSQVSGAGIGVLQTKPGVPTGNANLIAPHGTVDAGDAGIRVSGNINVAAAHVANAANISVGGSAAGVPTGVVDTGALGAGAAANSAANKAASDAQDKNKPQTASADTVLTGDVLGNGGGDSTDDSCGRGKGQKGCPQ